MAQKHKLKSQLQYCVIDRGIILELYFRLETSSSFHINDEKHHIAGPISLAIKKVMDNTA